MAQELGFYAGLDLQPGFLIGCAVFKRCCCHAAGDEIKLRHTCAGAENRPWAGIGQVVKLSDATEEITLELRTTAKSSNAFTATTTGWMAEFVWKSTSFDRMQRAMKLFAVDDTSVSSYLYHR